MSPPFLRVVRSVACALVAMLLCAGTTQAHSGEPATPENIWTNWNFDPLILVGIATAAALYGSGVRQLWLKAGVGSVVSQAQAAAFGVGLLVLMAALVSPLDPLGEALFSAHMVQHLVLILVAAPLLVYGAPLVPILIRLPHSWRRNATVWTRWPGVRSVLHAVTHPLAVWSLHTAVLWFWHMPALYQAAIRSEVVHALEHASFLGVAGLFWWVLIQPVGRRSMPLGLGVIFVFTTAVQSSALGALLTFAPTPWYLVHSTGVEDWGTNLLQDQQLAGLIMWVPGGLVYLAASLVIFSLWLQAVDRDAVTRNRTTGVLDSDASTDRFHSPRSG